MVLLNKFMPQIPSHDVLARLAAVIESRLPKNGGDADASYVARLLQKGRKERRSNGWNDSQN